ncbi:rRNA accumulation-related protein [Vermiconidia calcicola]|uniref:rRNA accumulation-related protein n=1 Tax=Vermiconidia calcicola TaxID=1690605 RepID=A0ACC3NGG8_9PEZI|nr:rRNA accumulation-related protein [Vermiconidia calcicola]
MASQSAPSGSGPTQAPGGGVRLPPPPEKLRQHFDNGIWYLLSLWPALHVAVRDSWGGPDSNDKRDWFAGAVSDLFVQRPDTDHDDLVLFLLQVMQDEFDCNVEDDSEEDVARSIYVLRKRLFEDKDAGSFSELEQRWRNRGQLKMNIQVVDNGTDDDDEDDWQGFDEEDEDGDINMEAAEEAVPNLVPTLKKEKPEPEVDDDGFTKVTGKKKR